MSARLDALRGQFDQVRNGIDTIEGKAVAESRDLTDAEQADVDALYTRAETLTKEITPLADRQRQMSEVADVLNRIGSAQRRPNPVTTNQGVELPTAGEYFASYFRAHQSGATADDQEHFRTVADQLTTDNAGILPTQIVGQLISFVDATRPLFASFTQRPMPDKGKTFTRPRITQHVNVDEQTTEKTEVASRKMTITSDNVSKRTFAGVLDVSQQDLDWTDPAILQVLLQDFADGYAEITEDAAATFFDTTMAIPSGALAVDTAAHALESLVNGAIAVYNSSKRMPDTLWASLDRWADLAILTDSFGHPLFPLLGAGQIDLSNAGFSGAPLGLRFVVSPSLPTDTLVIGNRGLVEAYEQRKGLLSAVQPSLLGFDIAYYGYVAFYGRPEGFVKLGG